MYVVRCVCSSGSVRLPVLSHPRGHVSCRVPSARVPIVSTSARLGLASILRTPSELHSVVRFSGGTRVPGYAGTSSSLATVHWSFSIFLSFFLIHTHTHTHSLLFHHYTNTTVLPGLTTITPGCCRVVLRVFSFLFTNTNT